MRICFFLGSMTSGGSERTAAALSKEFVAAGHQVTILTFEAGKSFYPLESAVEKVDLGGPRPSGSFFKAVFNNLKNIRYFRREVKRIKPDLVMCFSVSTLFTCLLGSPFVVTKIVGLEQANPYIDLQGSIWQSVKKVVSPFADGFIFQTARSMEFYPRSVQKKGIVIPNAVFVEDKEFANLSSPEEREKIICAVGILDKVKGFDSLIKSFAVAGECLADFRLIIYGEGKDRPELEELVAALGLQERVFLPGRTKEIIREISKASIFVLSSRSEGMPNVLIEAMACGLPCIATDCPMGPRELIDDGVNGILVPVDNVEAMAEAICRVAEDQKLACDLGARATSIRQTNSIEAISSKFLNYLESVHRGDPLGEVSYGPVPHR